MSIQSALPAWLQWAWAMAGLGMAAGALLWIFIVFWPYIRWSKTIMKESLALGQQTAGILQQVQHDLDPVITDVKAVVIDVRAMVTEFRASNDLEKISKALDKMAADGALEETLKAIQAIPAKLDAVLGKRKPAPGVDVTIPTLPGTDACRFCNHPWYEHDVTKGCWHALTPGGACGCVQREEYL